MNKTYCMPFLIAAIFCFSSSSAVVHAQSVVDFSFNRTGSNHSVLVLPIWHPVIKEMQQLDDLPSDFIQSNRAPVGIQYNCRTIAVFLNSELQHDTSNRPAT